VSLVEALEICTVRGRRTGAGYEGENRREYKVGVSEVLPLGTSCTIPS
jgi:hypothetical protein